MSVIGQEVAAGKEIDGGQMGDCEIFNGFQFHGFGCHLCVK